VERQSPDWHLLRPTEQKQPCVDRRSPDRQLLRLPPDELDDLEYYFLFTIILYH